MLIPVSIVVLLTTSLTINFGFVVLFDTIDGLTLCTMCSAEGKDGISDRLAQVCSPKL